MRKILKLKTTSSICSILIIVLAITQILDIWEGAINILELLLGILMLIIAIQNWKDNRKVAILNLIAAIFLFLVAIIVFLL